MPTIEKKVIKTFFQVGNSGQYPTISFETHSPYKSLLNLQLDVQLKLNINLKAIMSLFELNNNELIFYTLVSSPEHFEYMHEWLLSVMMLAHLL